MLWLISRILVTLMKLQHTIWRCFLLHKQEKMGTLEMNQLRIKRLRCRKVRIQDLSGVKILNRSQLQNLTVYLIKFGLQLGKLIPQNQMIKWIWTRSWITPAWKTNNCLKLKIALFSWLQMEGSTTWVLKINIAWLITNDLNFKYKLISQFFVSLLEQILNEFMSYKRIKVAKNKDYAKHHCQKIISDKNRC